MRTGTLCVFLVTLFASGQTANCPDRKQLLNDEMRLMKNVTCMSDSNYRPVKDYRTPVDVKVKFHFKYMTFDNVRESVTVFSWVDLNWRDDYLKWNATDYGGINETQVESHYIWSPLFILSNADIGLYHPGGIYTVCSVTSEGMVNCVPYSSHTVICSTSLSRWPYDDRNCTLHFTSLLDLEGRVNYTFGERDAVTFDGFQNAPGWKLLNITYARARDRRACCPYSDHMLRVTFVLKREAAGLAATVLIPSAVVVLLTLSTHLLNVKDNARLSLICFSLIAHFVFTAEIAHLLPKLSSDTPNILLFVRDSTILTLLGVWETLLLMSLTKRFSPAPNWIVTANRLVRDGPTKYFVFTQFDISASDEGGLLTEEDHSNERRGNVDWTQFANLINSCVYLLYLIVYLILICTYVPF